MYGIWRPMFACAVERPNRELYTSVLGSLAMNCVQMALRGPLTPGVHERAFFLRRNEKGPPLEAP